MATPQDCSLIQEAFERHGHGPLEVLFPESRALFDVTLRRQTDRLVYLLPWRVRLKRWLRDFWEHTICRLPREIIVDWRHVQVTSREVI
ncbi:MAG: hypothetical protein Q8P46_04985 [Hyphomicrobiales bacterium]|nr:hypothetical protein [Hyphomicrobiales bacterium]